MTVADLSWYGAAAPGRAGLREEGCRRLLAALREVGAPLTCRRYGRGDTFYREGEDGATLFVLTEGVARLFVSYPGHAESKKHATVLLLGPPEVFGHPLFAGGRSRRFSAEAVTECEVVEVPRAFLKRVIVRRPDVALEMATLLDLVLAEYEEVVGCLSPRKTEARLAKILQVLARKFGARAEGGGVAIEVRLTRTDLARMIASSRESVTKVVTSMRKRGILTMEDGRIVLLEPEGLAEISRK